ncbi:MAG: hypothetical protein QQN63_13395 [Nitrosopumilus sp.]
MNDLKCVQHGIDYRIACEECDEKWGMFTKITSASIEDNNQDEQTLEGS